MPPPLSTVGIGDTIPTDRTTWNAILGAARSYLRSRPGASARGLGSPAGDPQVVIRLRNDTGDSLTKFAVLTLGDPLQDVTHESEQVCEAPVLSGSAPITFTDVIGITLEPALPGAMARTCVLGVVPVKINVSDATHTKAMPSPGITLNLISSVAGPAHILWKEAGTGILWAVVLLCCGEIPGPAPGTPTSTTATPTGSSGTVDVGWTAPASGDAGLYVVGYSTSPSMTDPTTATVTSGTSATITGLADGTTYYVGVYSLSGNGDASGWSNIVSVTPYQEVIYLTSGSHTFTASYTGNHSVELWGGGGGGGSGDALGNCGGGGGGGEYRKSTLALTSGNNYTAVVGAAATDSTWQTTTVVAKAGAAGSILAHGAGGTGGTGTTGHAGGAGADGTGGGGATGGGGGGSGGSAAAGNAGSGATGGSAVTDGGAGGNGSAASTGSPGSQPGGGGGGGGPNLAGGAGAAGKVRIRWPA